MVAAVLATAFSSATFATEAGVSPRGKGDSRAILPEATGVRVTTKREGGTTHFYVENNEFCEVTMTWEMGLAHLKSNAQFPFTEAFPPRQVTEVFVLSPAEPGAPWHYSYTNHYKLGSNLAKHDDSCIYELPYGAGRRFEVTQGYNGKFSHKGWGHYAIDWKMPEGTPVLAARGGVVVRVKDDSSKGGSSLKYDCCNNYVLIRHDDGTMGHYCHLQKGGCAVTAGQRVQAGDLIAHSGNTGFSSGPHLHFCVIRTKDGYERESVPVKFRTAEAEAVTLRSGRTYEAAACKTEPPSSPTVSRQASHSVKSRT